MNSQQIIRNFPPNADNHQIINQSNLPTVSEPQKYHHNLNNDFTDDQTKRSTKKKIHSRTRFSRQEDEEIIRLVSLYGQNEWTRISKELKSQRTPKQCRDRYLNYLSPDIQNKEWTLEEDQCLLQNYFAHPNRWQILKRYLPGRSEIAIKNRFKHLEKDGMKILRPMIDENKNKNTDFSKIQLLSKLPKALDKFKSSKEDSFQSIIKDSTKIYSKHTKIYDNCKSEKKDIFDQNLVEDEMIHFDLEKDSFDFIDLFDCD